MKVGRKIDLTQGYRREIMESLLSAGVIPYRGFGMLAGQYNMYTRKILMLEKEGIVETGYFDGGKYCWLSDFENKSQEYLPYFPNGTYGYYERVGKEMKQQAGRTTDEGKRKRAMRQGLTLMLMRGAGIKCLYGEKRDLTSEDPEELSARAYYSIREMKINPEETQLKTSSRMIGCLIGEKETYGIYHIGDSIPKWTDVVEKRALLLVNRSVAEILGSKTNESMDSCIMFVDSYKPVIGLFKGYTNKTLMQLNTNVYSHMYVLPYSKDSFPLLRKLNENSRYELEKELNRKHLETDGYNTDTTVIYRCPIKCDGIKDNGYALNMCMPDILALNQFMMAAKIENEPDKYRIYCYDYQFPMIREIVEDNATVIIISPSDNKQEVYRWRS